MPLLVIGIIGIVVIAIAILSIIFCNRNNNEPRKKRGKEEHVSEDDFGDVALQEPLLDNNKNEINQINEQKNNQK